MNAELELLTDIWPPVHTNELDHSEATLQVLRLRLPRQY